MLLGRIALQNRNGRLRPAGEQQVMDGSPNNLFGKDKTGYRESTRMSQMRIHRHLLPVSVFQIRASLTARVFENAVRSAQPSTVVRMNWATCVCHTLVDLTRRCCLFRAQKKRKRQSIPHPSLFTADSVWNASPRAVNISLMPFTQIIFSFLPMVGWTLRITRWIL